MMSRLDEVGRPAPGVVGDVVLIDDLDLDSRHEKHRSLTHLQIREQMTWQSTLKFGRLRRNVRGEYSLTTTKGVLLETNVSDAGEWRCPLPFHSQPHAHPSGAADTNCGGGALGR